jgi:hypothetical protein
VDVKLTEVDCDRSVGNSMYMDLSLALSKAVYFRGPASGRCTDILVC